MKKTELLAALKKIVSQNDSFKDKVVDFFQNYLDGLDKLTNETFEIASSVLDFTGKKLLSDSHKLLDDFQKYHDIKKETYQEIINEYKLIDLAEKKRVTADTLKVFEHDISQLLKIYNVRAQIKVEDILLNDLDETFNRLLELKKLVNITFKDIVNFWENLPDDYILTYD